MRKSSLLTIFLVFGLMLCPDVHAQFKDKAFSQQYNDDGAADKDSLDVLFSFKDYFAGLGHKKELKIGEVFGGSMVFIGGCQIYNKQYWKLPIVYGGILGGVGSGVYLNSQGNHDAAKWCFIGAGAVYWASLLDGTISFKPDYYPHPGKATIYSILVPGLGQIYNKEYWKLPIYWGGMVASYYFYSTNRVNYERYRNIYKEATDPDIEYKGPITADVAKYYRDVYRRYRDYSILALAAVYLLQIIDANVFSYMHDFNVADDVALDVTPTVIAPDMQFASGTGIPAGVGLSLGLKF
ncbi:MAG: DUF5683 domain-containing protein [Bacteroidales bacterium]|nr:DUF5683 domain-containing protein [Bacteroidales bacterium]